MTTKAANLLRKSIEVINERDSTHGDYREHFNQVAKLWSAYLQMDIAPAQVGVMMALVKLSRDQVGGKHPDHLLDALGYIALAEATTTEINDD